eukprot:gnl/MRDRNA2_/MRDRNA2_28018_c0_seq1.p1 gnl/MRDRNA2_/MRDRNA2_28018_c0~~gnl/MRDRNA2_/MRDRNA2_28018_c0_seq1.p1  ORF type:complete len:924 (-),score=128.16 gnl/MRDRNA2_/MRDRNA2_28018_c0_seq1:67-2673(-)
MAHSKSSLQRTHTSLHSSQSNINLAGIDTANSSAKLDENMKVLEHRLIRLDTKFDKLHQHLERKLAELPLMQCRSPSPSNARLSQLSGYTCGLESTRPWQEGDEHGERSTKTPQDIIQLPSPRLARCQGDDDTEPLADAARQGNLEERGKVEYLIADGAASTSLESAKSISRSGAERKITASASLESTNSLSGSGTERKVRFAKNVSTSNLSSLSKASTGDIMMRSVWSESVLVSRASPLQSRLSQNMVEQSSTYTLEPSPSNIPELSSSERVIYSRMPRSLGDGKRCVIHPNTTNKLVWDVVGMVLIAYDTIWLPLNLSFEPPPNDFTVCMFWVTLCFWTIDIVISFFTGFYREGEIELSRRRIMCNYLSTWFLPDCIIVALDWMTVFADSERGATALVRMGKAFRGLRVLRSLRLLRLMKFMKVLEEIQDRIFSDWLHICLSVLKLTMMLLVSNHMIACIWWGVGRATPERNWIKYHGLENEDMGYKYLSALHWTLTQFTPAGMEVFPHNTPERAFAVVVLLFALLFFSSFLSSITSAMTQLRQLNYATHQQFSMLRRFLKEREIPQDLSMRIRRYLEHRVNAQKSRIQEKNIGILVLLSEPLHKELQEQTHKPLLCKHPFFDNYCTVAPQAMRHLCRDAVSTIYLSEGDTVFTAGAKCEQMIFVMDGKLLYEWNGWTAKCGSRAFDFQPTIPRYDNTHSQYLQEGDWCSEACLWANWVHVGTMRAVEMSNLLAIDAERFAEVTIKHTLSLQSMALYAERFVNDLNSAIRDSTDFQGRSSNDLSKPIEEIEVMCTEIFTRDIMTDSQSERSNASRSRSLTKELTGLQVGEKVAKSFMNNASKLWTKTSMIWGEPGNKAEEDKSNKA